MSQTFGRYTVVGQLGRGAMGVVYLASDPMLNRQVAIKTVDLGVDDPAESAFLRERLLRDARAAAVLKHPNIVGIYDVFEDGGRAYVVMEYVEGGSLSALLNASPVPGRATILNVLRARWRTPLGLYSRSRHHPSRHQTGQRHDRLSWNG